MGENFGNNISKVEFWSWIVKKYTVKMVVLSQLDYLEFLSER